MGGVIYALTMKDDMSETFLSALVAAGGNSRAARSARARLQWRDRYGRWIEMGRGVKFKVRGADGAPRSVIGSFVGAKDNQTGQVYVRNDPNGLPDGFYDVSSSNAQEFVANLSESQLATKGIEIGKDINGNPVGERASEDVPNINELVRADAPEGWEKVPGTFNGKNVIQTEDGDFRIHFGGKDETALLEDHRANPGVAEPQRSVAEAFKKVGDVDIQREEGGDQAYSGLGSEEENAAAVANLDRDAKIDQIKMNERTLLNERANLGAKQQAMTTNQQLMKELEDSGQPYDPEGNDSDEALAARKAAPQGAPEAADPAAPEAGRPTVTAGDIDLSSFDVAPEGFLVPTGKQTNDITPQGLANFMTAEKESLGSGGSRLVVDTDSGTAEIYNSADSLDDAKAQAGGLGTDTVLDLSTGQPVQVSEGAVDPNSPDVNPNLDGDTSQEAPSAEDRNSNAVESQPANPGADAPASDQPDAEAQRDLPAATGPDASDSPASGDTPAGADGDRAEGGTDGADSPEPAAEPGSVEELEARRNKVQAALDVAGDPKDIIALNEQADALDTRLAAERANAPEADAPEAESDAPEAEAPEAPETDLDELAKQINELEEQQNRLQDELERGASGREDDEISAEIDEVFDKLADLQSQFDELSNGPSNENDEPEMSLADKLDSAWAATDPFPDSNLERRERAALRILRDGEKNGNLEAAKKRLSQEEQDALSDEIAEAVGIERAKPEPETPAAAPSPLDEWTDDRIDEWRELQGSEGAPDGVAGHAWAVQKMKGTDGGPEVLSGEDFDNAEGEELFRGVSSPEQKAAFIEGDDFIGMGGNGSGIYLSSERGHAARYGNFEDERIIDAKLKPGANIVDGAELEAQRQADFERAYADGNLLAAQLASGDLNTYASAIGVDGYRIELEGVPSVVIANKNALIVRGPESSSPAVDAPEEPDEETSPTEPPAELDEARVPENAPRPQTWEPVDNTVPAAQPRVEEPGDSAAVAETRRELAEIDAEIDNELDLAERTANDPMEQAGHLSRVRTLERQRKIFENRLNRELGNEPMDFNRDLGWSLRDRENRGALPEAPEAAPEVEDVPEADTPAVLDEEISTENPVALEGVYPSSLREGDLIEHPVTGNLIRIDHIADEYDDFEGAHRYDISYTSRNDFEDDENRAESDPAQLWSSEKVNTYRAWRDTPTDPADPTDGDDTPAGPPATREEAQRRYDEATADYFEVLMKDDYTEEEYEAAEARREEARADYLAFDAPEDEDTIDPETQRLLDELDADPEREAIDARAEAEEREYREEGPLTDEQFEQMMTEASQIVEELNDRDAVEGQVSTADGLGGLYDGGDDPYDVESGNNNKVSVIQSKMQGKDFTPEERADLEEALGSGVLSDSQVARIAAQVDRAPNSANTVTRPRPEQEQPDYLSTADVDIVNAERDDPNFVFDEDLTWRRIKEEFPDATELENGDLILDTTNNKGKRYDTMIRRTRKNRFMVYVMETDQSGNRRAKRIGNTEWHSYEALEKRIQQGRALIHSKSPAGSLARRKDQPTENLGTQGFPNDDFIGDIGNPDAPLPETGDDKFDRLLAIAAEHIRNRDADLNGIEAALQQADPGANAINTIMQAIIGRAQDNYRPDGVAPWQTYDGGTAEIGQEYDWTDWHQEKDWWLPNGQLNPNRRPNENYGKVHRVRVMSYVKENSDGKGHTYGDHVWVQPLDAQGRPVGNWVKRSAQTLRLAEPGTDTGLPFFSKREEWRSDPELLARRFRVPEAAPEEPVRTQPRPRGDLPQGRRLRFTSRGNLAGYGNVPVPTSQAEIAGKILSGEITPQIRPARDARPGMMIIRMDADGNQHLDSIIRVENLGDGGYRIHAARPDGKGYADVDSFVVPGDADIALGTAPNLPGPRQPEPTNERQGELVSFSRDGFEVEGVVVHDDGDGNLIVSTPGGDTVDILESNIKPVPDPEVTQDQRQDLIAAMGDHDIPQYIQELIMQGILSPGLSVQRYNELVDVTNAFATKTASSRVIDWILDILGATDQQRADVRAFFNS